MAIYRNIQMSFWTDAKIGEFTPEQKLMYLYLMTNPHTNLCGCYEITIRQIAFETGFTTETASRIIESLKEHGVIDYSNDTHEIIIVNWHKYNWTTSEKLRKALEFSIGKIMYEPFRNYVADLFKGTYTIWDKEKYGSDTVSIPYGYNGNGNVSFRLGNVSDSLVKDNVSDSNTTTEEYTEAIKEQLIKTDEVKIGQQYVDPITGMRRMRVR